MIHEKTILIVDDEPRTREGIRKTLEIWSAGKNRIQTVASGVEAREWLASQPADLLITDVRMPELSGLSLVEAIQHFPGKPAVLIMSGYADFNYAQQAIKLGVVDYLLKPIDKEQLLQTVQKALFLHEQQRRIQAMQDIVDPKLVDIRERREQQDNTPIGEALAYIETHLGEPMTMRELADSLHLNSSYFSVLFKEQVGLNFSEYLMRKRVQRAKELLVQTNLPISEIAERVGYQTDKYFIKVFKSLENISPSKYRHSVNEKD
ncbi:two component transcriptional regulator, AraC family [Paenibacillus polysaccharolyticus]|uniref:Two component transcriptional regulator, AraC family n=1 Tax=Paenibacillus polysaccharolyticus TaxID=582692 RepID=A0A1G5JAR2_9BACL|nr:response regulator [Paenibacillus polysaccharolyticus]SCY85030.1 two component transcriptional regulator, AraC family [Paenibacillus polysaccharolyticus]